MSFLRGTLQYGIVLIENSPNIGFADGLLLDGTKPINCESMVTAVVPLLTVPRCRALPGNKYQVPKSLNTRYCHSNQNGTLCPGFEALWRYLLSDLEWYVRSTNYLPKMTENTLFPDSLTGFVLCFESTIHASTSWTAFVPLRSGYNRPVFS